MTKNDKAISEPANPIARNPVQPMALTIDWELYKTYLKDCDWSEDKKQEFLETLWSVVVGFVDLGFCVHPLQNSGHNDCRQEIDLSGFMASDVVSSKKSIPTNEFETVAAGRKSRTRQSEEI